MNPATIVAAASAAKEALKIAKQVKAGYDQTFRKQRPMRKQKNVRAVNPPAARGYVSKPPSVGADSIIVRNDECIGTYTSATADFDAQVVHIQPGDSTLFTVLGPQALRYQLYRVNKLRVYSKAQSGTSTDGSLTLAPQYSETNSPYPNIQAVNNLDGSVTGSIWNPISMSASPAAIHYNGNFKHVSQVSKSDDDAFDLVVAFSNASGKSILLYVEYEIMLFKKASPKGTFSVSSHSIAQVSSLNVPNTTFVEPSIAIASEVNPYGLVAASNRVVLPKGIWKIEVNGFTNNTTGAANYATIDIRCAEDGTALTGQQYSWAAWRLKFSAAAFSASSHSNTICGILDYVSDGTKAFSLMYALVTGTGTVAVDPATTYRFELIGSIN